MNELTFLFTVLFELQILTMMVAVEILTGGLESTKTYVDMKTTDMTGVALFLLKCTKKTGTQ